jgi:hypothetical protein
MIKKMLRVNIKGNEPYTCEVTKNDNGDTEVNIIGSLGWQARFINGAVVDRNMKCSYLAYMIAEWIWQANIETLPSIVDLVEDGDTLV